jgi:hypothetical protein
MTNILTPFFEYLSDYSAAYAFFQQDIATAHTEDNSVCHAQMVLVSEYEGVSKIFRTDTVTIINLTTKRTWTLPTSIQLHALTP